MPVAPTRRSNRETWSITPTIAGVPGFARQRNRRVLLGEPGVTAPRHRTAVRELRHVQVALRVGTGWYAISGIRWVAPALCRARVTSACEHGQHQRSHGTMTTRSRYHRSLRPIHAGHRHRWPGRG